MQQPFNPPGGSYGNAPYAAPPPKRGFNFLTCCLGCFGVAVVLAIIITVYVTARVKNAAGPPITAANYRAEFPAGVPIYPGLQFDEMTTTKMHLIGGFTGLVPKGNVKMRLMAFKSTHGMETVGPWYKARLVPKGWKLAGTSSSEKGNSWQFQKGDEWLMMSDSGQRRGDIVFMVGRGLGPNVHMQPGS